MDPRCHPAAHFPHPVIPSDAGFVSSLSPEFPKPPPFRGHPVLYFTRKTELTFTEAAMYPILGIGRAPESVLIYSGPFTPTGKKQDSRSSQSQPQAYLSCLIEPLVQQTFSLPPLLIPSCPMVIQISYLFYSENNAQKNVWNYIYQTLTRKIVCLGLGFLDKSYNLVIHVI